MEKYIKFFTDWLDQVSRVDLSISNEYRVEQARISLANLDQVLIYLYE